MELDNGIMNIQELAIAYNVDISICHITRTYQIRYKRGRASHCMEDDDLPTTVRHLVKGIDNGSIKEYEPPEYTYNPDEADIDRQLAAMRPKQPTYRSSNSSSTSYSSGTSTAPFIAMGFMAGITGGSC